MEDETATPSPDYIKGFNEGYILTSQARDLADKLVSVKSDSERTQGFKDGYKEALLEKIRDQRPKGISDPNYLKTLKDKATERDKDRNLDKDR